MNRTRDPLHTPVCDLLGIEYPIFSAPMGFVATPELVAAVSEAGGCGILPAVFDTPDELRAKIRRIRAVTQKPFGVNILFAQQIADPDSEEGRRLKANQEGQLEVVFDERVPLVSAALGNPGPLVAEAHRRGALVVSSVGNTRQARRVAEAGVDIIVATGYEGGGHSGRVGSAVLWPAVVSAVSVPVLAAGGVADGRGLVAALAMGCSGVWMGTRFLATPESQAHDNYRRKVVEIDEEGTVQTRAFTGKPNRLIRNRFTASWEGREAEILPFPQQQLRNWDLAIRARHHGEIEDGPAAAGQSAGLIHDIRPAAQVVRDVVAEARQVIASRFC